MSRLFYNGRPISTVSSLAADLGIPERKLRYVAGKSASLYRLVGKKKKSDGTFREIVDARPPLKEIQKQICKRLFSRVSFPPFLTGGLKGTSSTLNASHHVGARILFSEDISSFFPSVTDAHVLAVWKDFFRLPPDVASILTSLTTRQGCLPQGASTSSYLANCVLGRAEASLAENLSREGLVYTRYIDDLSVSARRKLKSKEIQAVVGALWGLATLHGFRLKRGPKHQIRGRGSRQEVTGLIVNKRVSLPKDYASRVRSQLDQLETTHKAGAVTQREVISLTGKVRYLQRFRPGKAKAMFLRLLRLK